MSRGRPQPSSDEVNENHMKINITIWSSKKTKTRTNQPLSMKIQQKNDVDRKAELTNMLTINENKRQPTINENKEKLNAELQKTTNISQNNKTREFCESK